MTDFGRQSATDKAGSALKPDSQKSTTEQLGDKIKSTGDSAASTAQPESEKSYAQQATDALSGNSNENSGSMLDKAKDAVGMGNTKNNNA
ncbi:hypothetical protein CONPUDRAFT_119624 [Coniophora puteana RWD-64-598 SS2]|uniref:Heat shock protein 9/12-domain-containing protein n=1 Tax=Coniophora puteana (strain RWD-64-598) TaxID=741705 RepID=A0A5M3MY45_CONPW|nr:uncharacterized protein CONPUDRAFT_119624 [Coniophora puteana RWD-64-598 SS2]EIW84058.1 hypothetical protein CONPUDRAFT_119624 [Coniophora puteana RWD-64-598 SS2]